MQVLFLTLVVVSNLFFQPQTTPEVSTDNICAPVETSSPAIQYPVNQTKSFLDVDDFYNQIDRTIYEEYNMLRSAFGKKYYLKTYQMLSIRLI